VPLPNGVEGIILDIEGTTTPVAFVRDTLFPYAQARLEAYCARAAQDEGVALAVELLREEHATGRSAAAPFGGGSTYAHDLMDRDSKSTGLKLLQGLIWEEGFASGELLSPVFPDVQQALESWRQGGVRLRVFSSGSALAQKLIFAHTEYGDLTGLLEEFHDTTTGPKRAAPSYAAISRGFELPQSAVLFLSDVVEELDVARAAGLQTVLIVRPGNRPAPEHDHPAYPDFLALVD